MNTPVQQTTSTKRLHTVTRADMPVQCPQKGATLWNSHPRVFLAVERTGLERYPYCGDEYTLREE